MLEMATIHARVREFIINSFLGGVDDGSLEDDMSLERSQIVDSAQAVELISFVEEEFGLEVDNTEATASNFDSVNAIVAYTRGKMAS